MPDWTTPKFEEVKMDAEIGSHQEDDPVRDSPIARTRDETDVQAN